MEALHDVVRAGKARYIGASSMYAWQFAKAQTVAAQHGWTRFDSMQNHYNLVYREEEREMIPLCVDQGVGIIPWSPLARGLLAGTRTAAGERLTDACEDRSVRRLSLHARRRLRCRRSGRRGRCGSRRPERTGRTGLAPPQAGGHGTDRRGDEDRPPRGCALRRSAPARRGRGREARAALRHTRGLRTLVGRRRGRIRQLTANASVAPDVERVRRQPDDQEQKDEARPRRRVLDAPLLGVEEHRRPGGRGDRETEQELHRTDIAHAARVRAIEFPEPDREMIHRRRRRESRSQRKLCLAAVENRVDGAETRL